MKLRKYIALPLALALLLTLFAACKKPATVHPGTTSIPTETPPPQAVAAANPAESPLYTATKLPIPFDPLVLEAAAENTFARSIFAYSGGRIYLERYTDIKNNGELAGQLIELYSVDLDGGDEQIIWSYEAMRGDANAKVQTFESLYTFNADDDGNLWFVMLRETQDNTDKAAPIVLNSYEIFKCSAVGELIGSSVIEPLAKELIVSKTQPIFDAGGNAYVMCNEVSDGTRFISVFSAASAEFVCSTVVDPSSGVFARAASGSPLLPFGENFAVYSLDGNAAVREVHAYAGGQNVVAVNPGYGVWDIIFHDYILVNALYGYSFADGKEAKLLDFTASDIKLPTMTGNTVATIPLGGIVQLSETEFLLSLASEGLYKLTPRTSVATEKVTITIGVTFDDPMLADAVNYFNQNSRTTRVEIKNYHTPANGDDRTEARTQLDLDILRGEGPDIISLIDFAPEKYISKGLLADLTPYLDSDESISRTDLFENVLDFGISDGKLYHVITHFSAVTMSGKSSIFGSAKDFDMARLVEVMKSYPDSELIAGVSAEQWIMTATQSMMDNLVSWETGTCDFDNSDFIALLNTAKALSAPTPLNAGIVVDDVYLQQQKMIYEQQIEAASADKILLKYTTLSDLRQGRIVAEVFGADSVFLGFPSSVGTGNALAPICDYGILTTSEHKNAAWSFISCMLQNEFPTWYTSNLSTNRNSFEERAAAEMVPIVDRWNGASIMLITDFGTGFFYDMISSVEGARDPKWANYHLTEAEIAGVRSAIENITIAASSDAMVVNVVIEELGVFLSGTRSAEETARIIQSRVSLYVAENS